MLTVKKFNPISDIVYTQMPQDRYRFIEDGENYDVALVRSAEMGRTQFPKQLLAIARAGAGVNNIPVDRCSEEGIVVFNTPGANANAVKELVLCGMMLACRRIVPGIQWVQRQHDEGAADVDKRMEKAKKDFVGGEIAGKTLGVIGLGAIGVMVANAAVALGMDVVGYDPFLSVDAALRLSRNVKLAKTREELLGKSDFVTLHLPQTPKTQGMMNGQALAAMKPGAVLLNFARGGLIEDDAVLAALQSGQLGPAGRISSQRQHQKQRQFSGLRISSRGGMAHCHHQPKRNQYGGADYGGTGPKPSQHRAYAEPQPWRLGLYTD